MNISNILKNPEKRKKILTLLLTFFLYAFVISRIFAYYSSSDEVTNRISGKSIGLELYEPEWDKTGFYLAKKSEPGMTIPKDPYAKNTGNMDEVVRLKLEIRLDESTAKLPAGNAQSDALLQEATDTERKIAILRSILYSDGNSVFKIEKSGKQTAIGNDIHVKSSDGVSYFIQYQGNSFLIEDATVDGENFDFYFYYIGNNIIGGTSGYEVYTREHTMMEVLAPNEATPKLFNKLVYPIYKKDYLTVFDQKYDINIYAEGILCLDFDEKDIPYTVENFKKIAEQ